MFFIYQVVCMYDRVQPHHSLIVIGIQKQPEISHHLNEWQVWKIWMPRLPSLQIYSETEVCGIEFHIRKGFLSWKIFSPQLYQIRKLLI